MPAYLQMDMEEAVTLKSRGGKSRVARTEWAHSKVFSSDDEEEAGGRSRASLWGGTGLVSKAPRSQFPGRKVNTPPF